MSDEASLQSARPFVVLLVVLPVVCAVLFTFIAYAALLLGNCFE